MHESVVIITGANRGIGYQTAVTLANLGHIIIMACRNLERSRPALEAIKQQNRQAKVELMEMDLSDPTSIRTFVSGFEAKYSRLNILINNAGAITRHPILTAAGFDSVIATNYLGPYLLTRLLLPSFEAGADNRIINLTSSIFPFGNFDFAKLNHYRWVKSYAVSKYLILLYTFELADRLREKGITVNAVDPGIVKTTIMFTDQWYDAIIDFILLPFYVSIEKGSETTIFAATSQDLCGVTGECLYKCGRKRIRRRFRNDPKRAILFAQTDRLLGLTGQE